MAWERNTADYEIRPARQDELSVVRKLVPGLYRTAAPDRVLVAVGKKAPGIIGAIAIAWRIWGKPPGFPVYIYVTEPNRRAGVATALIASAARPCRGETDLFHGWTGLDEGAPEARFARAVGCVVNRRVMEFEVDGLAFFSMIDAVYTRVQRRSRTPADARIAPLASVPHARVARLVTETFGSRYDAVLAATRGEGAGGYDRQKSVVLLVRDQVCGALLYRWFADCPEIDVNVVAPEFRGRWANIALLREATRNGLEGGARRFRFKCEDAVIDSINLARRANAKLLSTKLEFCVPLDALLKRSAL